MALGRAMGRALSTFIAWMLLWCLLDRAAQFDGFVRLAALGVGTVLSAVWLIPLLRVVGRQCDWVDAAAEAERRTGRFGQRLVTVTSRLLGASNYRGSDQMLIRLAREVDDQIAAERAGEKSRKAGWLGHVAWWRRGRLSQVGAARRGRLPVPGPWVACMMLLLSTGALAAVPGLGLAQLSARFFLPLAAIAPVTTTQLAVKPGDCDVVQSQPVTIDVRATELGRSWPTLFLVDEGQSVSRVALTAAGGGRFKFTVPAVDRDIRYHVTGGDARSPDYLIRVLRRPAVAQFRIRYDFPPYTRLAPTTVVNTDGRIIAPAGTHVHLVINATEPLQAALLTIGNDRLLMEHAGAANSRQADFVVSSATGYTLDLISTREVAGSGPPTAYIRAIPDLAPQVRLARSGETLRLNPRDIVPVWYEALDDFGIKSMAMRAQVNGREPVEVPVRIWGDPRRQQDVFNFDLATLPLGLGDLVKLNALATDTAGHETESVPIQILVSPRSIDLDAYQRISELQSAAQLARNLTQQMEDAVRAHQAGSGSVQPETSLDSATSRGDRALSAAAQTATLLRQSLLRAITQNHRPELSIAMATWIDRAEQISAAAEEAFREGGTPTGISNRTVARMTRAMESSRQLQSDVAAVEQGERAAAVLADMENLQATQNRPVPADEPSRRRHRETLTRIRQDIVVAAGQLGLSSNLAELEGQLRGKTESERQAVETAKPVDFAQAVEEWSRQARHDPRQHLGLESRLLAAAQAEAIRPDADLLWARDLDLASRAAGAIAAGGRVTPGKPLAGLLDRFVTAMRTLNQTGRRERTESASPADAANLRQAAGKARQQLSELAGDVAVAGTATTRPAFGPGDERQHDAENLALAASAAAASHQYDQAAALDDALQRRLESMARRSPTTAPGDGEATPNDRLAHLRLMIQREMITARQIDDIDQTQEHLRQIAATPGAAELAGQQQGVADQIAQVAQQRDSQEIALADPFHGRDKAAAVVLAAQEKLSAIPQELAAVQSAWPAWREARQQSQAAHQQSGVSPDDQRQAADRAAAEAEQATSAARDRLGQSLQPLSSKFVQNLADSLKPFAPETDPARAALQQQLSTALDGLEQACSGTDRPAVDRAATDVRKAIESAQRELAGAQESLFRRDPLAAARWFAHAAADDLQASPPDLSRASAHQASASTALARAWDQSIHRAAVERLAAIPAMTALIEPAALTGGALAAARSANYAAAREWSRLRGQESTDVNTAMHDADPPGFEESLKLYFEALGRTQENK
jgi:hypothetical protein